MPNKVAETEELKLEEQNTTVLESVAAAMVSNRTTAGLTTTTEDDTVVDISTTTINTRGIIETTTNNVEDKMAVEAKQQAHNAVSTPLGVNPTQIVETEFTPAPVVEVTQTMVTAPTTEVQQEVDEAAAVVTHTLIKPIQEVKMDMILGKLDEILTRLDRIEALTVGGNLSMKSGAAARGIIKPKMKVMKTPQGTSIQEINLHYYDNEYHVLPQGWILPKLNFEGLMQFWYIGDPSSGVPPLIKVGGTEFKNLPRGVRKRSDMKYLMKHVERKGKELGCFVEGINEWSLDSVRTLFDHTRSYFEYPNKSSTQTKFEKLSWETVCHNLRRNKGVLVGEDPLHSQTEEMDHGIQIPLQHEAQVPTIPVHVNNENPIAQTEEMNDDVVMEEAGGEEAPSEKEPQKQIMI